MPNLRRIFVGGKIGADNRAACLTFLQSAFQTMIPLFDVTDVRILPGYQLVVRFEDGLEGRVDLSQRLQGPVFGPLQDEALFAKAYLELGTVAWPNGADLAPDAMYDEIKRTGCWKP
jgi:hypothetical protein